MALHLTPEILERCYELLRATQPFRRWSLPPADEVVFIVATTKNYEAGWHTLENGRHTIAISGTFVGSLSKLAETMAHEMTHAVDRNRGSKSHHGTSFKLLATQVCKYHGFDPKGF